MKTYVNDKVVHIIGPDAKIPLGSLEAHVMTTIDLVEYAENDLLVVKPKTFECRSCHGQFTYSEKYESTGYECIACTNIRNKKERLRKYGQPA